MRSTVSIFSRRQSCSSTTTGYVRYMNPAAENLFGLSSRNAEGAHDRRAVQGQRRADRRDRLRARQQLQLLRARSHARRERPRRRCTCRAPSRRSTSRRTSPGGGFLIEFRHIEQQLKIAREERMLDQSQANRELIRNLAHEIKNPLGGIRGAAQLLDRELERPGAARIHAGHHEGGRPPAAPDGPAAHAAPPAAAVAGEHPRSARARAQRDPRGVRRHRACAATTTRACPRSKAIASS